MNNGKLKTIFLAGLILTSIFQTGELWFGNLSSRNFFYNLWTQNSFDAVNYSGEPIYLLQPRRIIINLGVEGGAYNVLKNTEEEFAIAKDEMTQILTYALSEGEYVKEENLDWKKILSQKSILYQYSESIPSEGLIMDQNKVISKIPQFNQILIVPSKNISQKTSCYFIDEEQDKVYMVTIKQSSIVLNRFIDEFRKDSMEIVYISTKQRNINQFHRNVFLPTFNVPPAYQKIDMRDPVREEGIMNEKRLEQIVNPLFTNPTLKRKEEIDDGTVYYIEGNVMVKYFPVGVIEYTDQSSTEKDRQTSFIEAYQIAKGFLDKHQASLNTENLLENPLYLSGQSKTDTGWEFYFDFRLQDIPYIFSREIREDVGMQHAVKMIIQDKKVKLYRRLTWEGRLLDEEKEINVAYPEALGGVINILSSQGVEQIQIDDMYWAYYQKQLNMPLEVYWMINVDGKIYPIKASQ